MRGLIVTSIAQFRAEGNQKAACIFVKKGYTKYNRYKTRRRGSPCQSGAGKREMRMFSNQPRKFYRRSPLIEVICQLRFPDILKIEAHEPADFQDAIRSIYPQYAKRIEQLPPQNAGGKMVEQGTVNNYQFISADGGWKVTTVADLPYVHRFDILQRGGVTYLIACCIKSNYEYKDDWRFPGMTYALSLIHISEPTRH